MSLLAGHLGDVAEPARVVDTGAAEQPDADAILVRENPPAVDLLLIDPAGPVEGLGDKRRLHRGVLRKGDPLCS